MDAAGDDALEAAMTNVFTRFDHLLRLLENGALAGLTEAQFVEQLQRLEQVRNRMVFLERQVLAELMPRRLPAAG